QSRVFVATQFSLSARPVVLKFIPREAAEHLSLARLQHTHIVPLYSVHDYPDYGLQALCLPYFGGATLFQVLEAIQGQEPGRRTGQNILDALDRAQSILPVAMPCRGSGRQALASASYAEAICWLGGC